MGPRQRFLLPCSQLPRPIPSIIGKTNVMICFEPPGWLWLLYSSLLCSTACQRTFTYSDLSSYHGCYHFPSLYTLHPTCAFFWQIFSRNSSGRTYLWQASFVTSYWQKGSCGLTTAHLSAALVYLQLTCMPCGKLLPEKLLHALKALQSCLTEASKVVVTSWTSSALSGWFIDYEWRATCIWIPIS